MSYMILLTRNAKALSYYHINIIEMVTRTILSNHGYINKLSLDSFSYASVRYLTGLNAKTVCINGICYTHIGNNFSFFFTNDDKQKMLSGSRLIIIITKKLFK